MPAVGRHGLAAVRHVSFVVRFAVIATGLLSDPGMGYMDGITGKTGAMTGDIVVFTREEFVRMRNLFDEYKRLLRSMAAEV